MLLGQIGTGIAMLVAGGGLGILALVDRIIAVAGVMKDKEGTLVKNWYGIIYTGTVRKASSTLLPFGQHHLPFPKVIITFRMPTGLSLFRGVYGFTKNHSRQWRAFASQVLQS